MRPIESSITTGPVIAEAADVSVIAVAQVATGVGSGESLGTRGPLPVDQYLVQRTRYQEARSRGQQRIDRLVVGGAAGVLTLSISFLHDIAPNPHANSKPWLLSGWISLILSLGLSMASHETSARAFAACLKHLDDDYSNGRYTSMPTSGWSTSTTWLNRLGAVLLGIGLIALARFAYVNIPFTEVQGSAANTVAPAVAGRKEPSSSSAPTSAASPSSPGTTSGARAHQP